MQLKWEDFYSVNVKEIDEQHQEIFKIINKLLGDGSKNPKELLLIINEMEEYSYYHFAIEEKYFKEFNYVDKEVHEKMHQAYIEKVQEFKEKGSNFTEVRDFLVQWWVEHIQGADHQYSDTFNQHGLF